MQEEKELKVGQTVWVKRHARGKAVRIEETKIKSIGRKYFYLESEPNQKWDAKSLRVVTDFSNWDRIYFSYDELAEEVEVEKLTDQIRKAFSGWGKLPYTLEQLRTIDKIISEQKVS